MPGSLVGDTFVDPLGPPVLHTRIIRPLRDFLAHETASALLIAFGALVALGWANSGWASSYHSLLSTTAGVSVGGWELHFDLRHWINDGLMALFFLVVGLEIKREVVEGELASPRHAALPALAALGGMVVPALVFVVCTAGTPHVGAWGIPVATDIALALGVVTALGTRVPTGAKVFLLALAIVDDIGAIVIIGVVYSAGISGVPLGGAIACVVAVVVLGRLRPDLTLGFVVLGVAMWWCLHDAGLHPTLAGVAMGLLTPTTSRIPRELVDEEVLADVSSVDAVRETLDMARGSVSRVEWLEHVLHPWTSLLVVPVFAFANAGLDLGGGTVRDALSSRVALGVLAGLVIGKPLGITAAVWLGRRLGLELPAGVDLTTVAAIGLVAGIGFTVSVFVADLAIVDTEVAPVAKLAVMVASLLAAAVGALVVVALRRRHERPVAAAAPS